MGYCWFNVLVDSTLVVKSAVPLSVGTTLGVITLGVELLDITTSYISAAACASPSVINGLDGDVLHN